MAAFLHRESLANATATIAAIAGLALLTAAQISPYLKSGAVSVVSYARALMRRVNQRNDVVKAWRHIGVLSFRRENMSIL